MLFQKGWKGKERAMDVTVEGTGGEDGIVLSLALVGTGVYDAAYTIPVNIGDRNQQFSLQIDTGSSDLWIASTSCSSSSCGLTKGHLYDPGGATQTGQDFSIPYLSGSAAGPIVWDKVTIGGYTIDNQALAAANDVENEPLAPNFSGILGLALPLNSIIASDIPPVTNNNPDGAAWASNLFSLTPISTSPSSRFLSLALSRPGSDRIPAVFGIGHHPSSIVPDPSLVRYSTLVSDRPGTLFWKVSVKALTVYVDGKAREVQLERSNTGASSPVAVLDSGVSLILTTSDIADGIYGAIGIGPASDGMYYVPCTTPLNMSITLDDRPEIPLHPLDLTAEPPEDNKAQFCIGLIQTADSQLSNRASSLGDMILGVPFLRNVYTVMAYTTPNQDGSFVPLNGGGGSGLNQTMITPRLGLLSLTDPVVALKEFNTVRVLQQSISDGNTGNSSSSSPPSSSSPSGSSTTVNLGGKRLSVGIVVLIGLLSFFALCCVLFVIRWYTFRRKYRQQATATATADTVSDGKKAHHHHQPEGDHKSSTEMLTLSTNKTTSSKDEKSWIGYASVKVGEVTKNSSSDSTVSSDRTQLAVLGDEFGVRDVQREEEEEEEEEKEVVRGGDPVTWPIIEEPDHHRHHFHSPPSSPDHRVRSSSSPFQQQQQPIPPRQRSLSSPDYDDYETDNDRITMVGIGTAY